MEFGQLTFGSRVSYECDTCFYLDGPKERECLGNESWSGIKPVCKRIEKFLSFLLLALFPFCFNKGITLPINVCLDLTDISYLTFTFVCTVTRVVAN